jgi:tRNA pseudouridine38-40 synthase
MGSFRLTIAYDGTAYHGWQVQPNGLTIQEVLQRELGRMTGEAIVVHGSGRTDAGVHAWGQVAHFHTASRLGPAEFFPGLNALLPDDIVCRRIAAVPPDFHARKHARRKTYCYCIDNHRPHHPLAARYAWNVRRPLDLAAMRRAADFLVGEHDFASFKAADGGTVTSTRRIFGLRIWRRGRYVLLLVTADGFLKNMVRVIAGTLVECGLGKRFPEDFPAIIAARDRAAAGITAPAKGLILRTVHY